MVENVTVTPGDVRGGNNIVMANKTKEDFGYSFSKVTEGTDTIDNVTETIFISEPVWGSGTERFSRIKILENPYWFEDEITITVRLQYASGSSWVSETNTVTLYCDCDGETYSQQAPRGTATFTIHPKWPGLITLRFYFKGYTSRTGTERFPCSKIVTVLSCSADAVFEFIDHNTVMQTDDVNPILTRLTCNGIGIPNQLVQFYEDYIEAVLRVYSNKSIIQTDDVAEVFARLSDEDGSAIKGKLVKFYEEYGDIEIVVNSDKQVMQSGETAVITARMHDEDGVVVGEQIDFYEEYDIWNVTAYANPSVIQTGDTATVYGKVQDEDGSLVEGALVQFYEDYDLSAVRVYAAKNIIQSSDTVAVYARVSDEDGSAVPGQTVHFYEDYEVTNITLSSSKNPMMTGETAVLTSKLKDDDGSVVRDERVDYSIDYEDDYSISMTVNKDLIQTGEVATPTVTVKEGNTPVEDVYIRFYDIHGEYDDEYEEE